MDPYKSLGIDSSATTWEVKRAFRKRASRAHPDRPGGSADEFHALRAAYDLLIDPARRARYDATGDDEKPRDARARVLEDALAMLVAIVDSSDDPLAVDPIQEAKRRVRQTLSEIAMRALKEQKRAAKFRISAKRFRRTKDGENLVLERLLRAAESAERLVSRCDEEREHGDALLLFLDEYEYEVDAARMMERLTISGGARSFFSGTLR